jgi:tRNA (guanine37-N1)-methyltransferase
VGGELDVKVSLAVPADVPELFTLTRACWVEEAIAKGTLDIPAFVESIDDLRGSLSRTRTWVARTSGRLVGSVRTEECDDDLRISRLMVVPDLQGRGLDAHLLRLAERSAPSGIRTLSLVAGARSADTVRMYRKAGYRPAPGEPAIPGTVELVKRRKDR